jgi:hypothetical protein
MLSGLFIAIGLAGTSIAGAEDDTDPPPPTLVLANLTVSPTTTVPPSPTIIIPVDTSIPPTTVAPTTVPPTQPESGPTHDIVVPVTAPISVPTARDERGTAVGAGSRDDVDFGDQHRLDQRNHLLRPCPRPQRAGWGTPSTAVIAIPMTKPSAPQNVVATPVNSSTRPTA